MDYSKRTAQVSGQNENLESGSIARTVTSVAFGQIVFAEGLFKQTIIDLTESDG